MGLSAPKVGEESKKTDGLKRMSLVERAEQNEEKPAPVTAKPQPQPQADGQGKKRNKKRRNRG
jgi:hypothetical protein